MYQLNGGVQRECHPATGVSGEEEDEAETVEEILAKDKDAEVASEDYLVDDNCKMSSLSRRPSRNTATATTTRRTSAEEAVLLRRVHGRGTS